MAIAQAVLEHLITTKRCKSLFVTHYPVVATELARQYPDQVRNAHMAFSEDTRIDGTREITFLYQLADGLATESFGIECARLADVPEDVLALATTKAEQMCEVVKERQRRNRSVRSVTDLEKVSHILTGRE
jgi:DNA mismatch repair protein MSH3